MGHVRLRTLSQSKKWRDVIGLLDSDAPVEAVAEAAALASELDLGRASDDPSFQFVTSLLVQLPLMARAPGFDAALRELGVGDDSLGSVSALLAGLSHSIDEHAFMVGRSSDAGELARAALLESLSVQLRDKLPTLFEPTPQEIRKALA
ncbi:MAG: hypothetical protein ACC631_11045, partial [Halocynthiibacter sp.]